MVGAPIARIFRVDPVLVIVSALAFGAVACVSPGAVFGVALSCLVLWRRWLTRRERALAALALSLGWVRAIGSLARFESEEREARQMLPAPSRCAVRGQVTGSPQVHDGSLRFLAELRELDCEGRIDARPRVAHVYGPVRDLGRGDQFDAILDLGPLSYYRNFDLPDPRPALARQGAVVSGSLLSLDVTRPAAGLGSAIDHARNRVRARILATMAGPVRGMARALVLGENDLSDADDRAFKKSGLSHLLAVSGTHLIFAVLGLVRGLEAMLRRVEWLAARRDVRRLSALLGLALGPLYADFAGGSGSAWRAAWMLVAVFGVRCLGRHVFPSRVVAASLGCGWLADGLVVFDVSFLLSLAATVGLLALGRSDHERALLSPVELTEPRRPNLPLLFGTISRASLTTLAASLPCVPVLLSLAPGMTLASVAANLLAAPLGETVALPLCLTHALLAGWPALERGVALVASGALALIRGIACASASVDWLYVELPPPSASHFAVLSLSAGSAVALWGASWVGASRRRCVGPMLPLSWAVASVLGLVGVEWLTAWEHSQAHGRALRRLRVTALDVGQGDASLVDLPDGRLLLIDGGGLVGPGPDPGENVILPVLRARRRAYLDIVVLSHPHPDHYAGLLALAPSVGIGEFWYGVPPSEVPAPDGTTRDVGGFSRLFERLRARGIPMRAVGELCQGTPATPGYTIEVLGPCPDIAPEQGANDNSLVLRIQSGDRAALFPGDAERWAEARLMLTDRMLSADFLKVGHHGSRSSSTPEFVARVHPRVASVSSGRRNRFGHPHAETLHTLAALGVLALRLDQCGSVEWQTDGQRQAARTFACPVPEIENQY